MRAYVLALSFMAFAAPAAAQSTPADSLKTFASSTEVTALMHKVKALRNNREPMMALPMLSATPFHADLEYRPGVAPAVAHEKDAMLLYVVDGVGTIEMGGTLVNEKRGGAAERVGASVSGAQAQPIGKGDFVLVPQNVPYQIFPTDGGPLYLVAMRMPKQSAP